MNSSAYKSTITKLTFYVCIVVFFALHKFITLHSEIKTFEIRRKINEQERNIQEKMTVSAVNYYSIDQSNEQSLRIIRLEEKVKKLETHLENITKFLSRIAERNDLNSSVFTRLSEENQTIKTSEDNNQTSLNYTEFPESGAVEYYLKTGRVFFSNRSKGRPRDQCLCLLNPLVSPGSATI